MNLFKKILIRGEDYILALILAVMVVISFANALIRYIISLKIPYLSDLAAGYSIAYLDTLVTYIFVYATFLGAAAAARRGAHLGMAALTDLLPDRLQIVVRCLSAMCMSILAVVIIYSAYILMEQQIKFGSTLGFYGWPAWLETIALPIGCVILIIRIWQPIFIKEAARPLEAN
jgi:TRAP-type C4-dicarboxylate transport system permease small subunit